MSGKTGIIIQARMSSSRLPGKSLMKIGERPLIWYVVKRAERLNLPVVVCTSTDSTDDVLCSFLDQEGIDFFRGDLHNVLNRYLNTAEEYNFENIVRITGDNPLFDFEYLRCNLHLFNNFSYVDGIYDGGLIKGTGFELVKIEELRSVRNPTLNQAEHVTIALREVLRNNSLYIQLSPQPHDVFKSKISLTCDFYEDLQLLRGIFAAFNYRFDISITEIIQFLKLNSETNL